MCSWSWSAREEARLAVWRSDEPVNKEVREWIIVWEVLRYLAAWGGTGLIIWFWYWMFSNIGTF